MRTQRIYFCFFSLLCMAAIALALLVMTRPAPPPDSPAFLVCDEGGRVAVYCIADGPPQAAPQVYDIYVNLLPEADALRLKQGILLAGPEEVQRLLEDLGA